MKTNIILTILYLSFCCHITNAQITEHEAFNILENKVITKSLDSLEIFVTKTLLPNNTEVTSYSNTILKTTEDSWMFFIDEQPFENWSHQCKYVFINSSENFKVVEATMFPTYPKMVDLEMINSPSALYKKSEPIIPYQTSLSLQDEIQPRYIANKYALIISGGVNSNNNHERYWNDCSSIYTTLVKKYYYSASNIYVLMADGTDSGADLKKTDGTFISSPLDLDGNGTNDIKYSATKANLRFVFSELANKLTPNDLLFIYTMDHGGFNSNGSYLCLWGNSSEYMDVSEFTSLVNQINAKAINIVMGQCNSGGFVEYFKGNSKVSITTACKKDESSYAMSNLKYDEFVYYWTEAYNNTLSVHSNFISTEKAFNYAKSHDTKSETPQFYASNFNSTSVSINDVWTEVTGFVNFNGNGSSHLTRSFDGAIGTIPIKTTYPIEIVITHPNTPISTN